MDHSVSEVHAWLGTHLVGDWLHRSPASEKTKANRKAWWLATTNRWRTTVGTNSL
jgi:hypothetical protein